MSAPQLPDLRSSQARPVGPTLRSVARTETPSTAVSPGPVRDEVIISEPPSRFACVNFERATTASPTDLGCLIGAHEYYRARHDDFIKRNPGSSPPEYYLEYGEKYALSFSLEARQKLSPEGKGWLDRTFRGLQQAIEDKRVADPDVFAALERDPEAFKSFAYQTHSKAYLQAGLADLPIEDLLIIATTPEIDDLATEDGVRQIAETAAEVIVEWQERYPKPLIFAPSPRIE